MIYLDNASTSWPKPPEVMQAMVDFLERAGGNPGRAGHALSAAAGRIVSETREAIAELFNVSEPVRVIFTQNATYAMNLAIGGLLRPGDRVVTTGIEHNAAMRPLRALEKKGLRLAVVPCGPDARLDPAALERQVTPGTRLIVVNHANNVTGTLLPLAEAAGIAHRAGALLLVDAAQTAGAVPIDVQAMGIDLLAFTGHKGLLGPPGTGGLAMGDRVDVAFLEPLVRGGTGSRSEDEEQPEVLPDKFESGTPNGVGLAGLGAGVRFVMAQGVVAIGDYEAHLAWELAEGLRAIPGVRVYAPGAAEEGTATLSFTAASHRVSEIGRSLDQRFRIMARVGLHCSPATHRTIGTFPEGTVRFAPGFFTTIDDIRATIKAVEEIVAS